MKKTKTNNVLVRPSKLSNFSSLPQAHWFTLKKYIFKNVNHKYYTNMYSNVGLFSSVYLLL